MNRAIVTAVGPQLKEVHHGLEVSKSKVRLGPFKYALRFS